MKVDFDPNVPIYRQIIRLVKRQIASGERGPGSRVEPVRDFARALGVNPNTVQRAFAELERQGLLASERTAGRFVTGDTALISALKRELAAKTVSGFITSMKTAGFSDGDILRLVRQSLSDGRPAGRAGEGKTE